MRNAISDKHQKCEIPIKKFGSILSDRMFGVFEKFLTKKFEFLTNFLVKKNSGEGNLVILGKHGYLTISSAAPESARTAPPPPRG